MSFLFSALSKFLAGLLVAVLTGAIFTMVLNQTLLNSKYLEHQLASEDAYSRLSVALTDQITKQADNPEAPVDPAQVEKLKAILTPALLQTKINGALEAFQAFYRGNGPQPTLDLTDVVAQAQAAGIPIPADSDINKPIPLGSSNNKNVKNVSKGFDQVRTSTLITSLVLVVALLAVSWERHKWAALPDVAITVGVLLLLLAAAFSAASGMAGHYVKFDTQSNAFVPIGRDLAASIAHDLAKRLAIFGGVLAVVGVATRIWVARLHPQTKIPAKPTLKPNVKSVV